MPELGRDSAKVEDQVRLLAWLPILPTFGKRQWIFGNLQRGLPWKATSRTEAAVQPNVPRKLKQHSALLRVIAAGSAAPRLFVGRARHETRAVPKKPQEGR